MPSGLPAVQITETPIATETPLPLPGKVILIATDPSSQQAISAQTLLSELSAAAGLELQVKGVLNVSEIAPEWKLVVLLSLDENLSAALAAAPQVQFLVISPYDLGMAANLNVIRTQPEQAGFLAGYVTTLAATDWRAAGFFTSEEPMGSSLDTSFRNGGGYFCGACVPYYAPLVRFPITGRIIPGSDEASKQAVIEQARQSLIYAAYVSPEISSPELLTYLAQQGIILVGGVTPPDELRASWAATITQDSIAPIRALFPDLIAGQGGKIAYVEVAVNDINEAYITPGKLRLVMETVEKLNSGDINPASIPLQ